MTTTQTHSISNFDDIIDSRDIIARIEALTSERDDLQATVDDVTAAALTPEHDGEAFTAAHEALEQWITGDEGQELKALEALASEAEGYAADWHYGEALIRDSYFETYAQELADDIGAIKSDAQWPMTCIDWKQAARELQHDYTSVDFDGVTFWVR